jgi:hypothetical protein
MPGAHVLVLLAVAMLGAPSSGTKFDPGVPVPTTRVAASDAAAATPAYGALPAIDIA